MRDRKQLIIEWFQALGTPPQTPAGQALGGNLVTGMELLRLKAVARLYARSLPPAVGWSDLLQEAFARVLDGSRKCPAGVPKVVFLAGVMRSIRAQYCRRARRFPAQGPYELEPGVPAHEACDPAPGPERNLAALQELARIDRLFAHDRRARQILKGLYEGHSPEEIRSHYDMSKTDYDSTRRRIRRVLLREGLRCNSDEN